jgi:protein-disulfide isomerase
MRFRRPTGGPRPPTTPVEERSRHPHVLKEATVKVMYKKIALLAVAAVIAIGCADPKEVSDIKAKVDEMQAQQKDILTKLDDLAKGQKQLLAKAPAAAPSRPQEDPNKVYDIPIGKSYVEGPKDAKVTIIEFSDFQCPFCSQAASLLKQILEAYPNDVKLVYKNYPLPFHKQAMPAAQAAVAAGQQGKFFEMHDKLFENQRSLSDDFYTKAAQEIGLDVEKFKTAFDSAETKALIQTEMKEARASSVRGTPTIFINGKKPQGRSFDLYKGIIDGILKKG